jgi:hypothetical protein
LLVICAKKSKDAPADVLGPFVLSLLNMCEAGLLQKTEYSIHKRLCRALKDVGCNHWYALMPQPPQDAQPVSAAAMPEVCVFVCVSLSVCVVVLESPLYRDFISCSSSWRPFVYAKLN